MGSIPSFAGKGLLRLRPLGNLAGSTEMVAVPAHNWIQLAQQPGQRRDPQENSHQESERHAQEDFTKCIDAGIDTAVGKDQLQRLLAGVSLQLREAKVQI